MSAGGGSIVDWDDVQSLLRFGHRKLGCSSVLLGSFGDKNRPMREWLTKRVCDVTNACALHGNVAANVAFTSAGLKTLGFCDEELFQFPPEFTQGMDHRRTRQVLGDGDAIWEWGDTGERAVHVAVLLYAKDSSSLHAAGTLWRGRSTATWHEVPTRFKPTEPFGFRDSISNPILQDGSVIGNRDVMATAMGEFIFGYADERGLLPLSPALDHSLDLGRNGSLLVLRQLKQHVDCFQNYLNQQLNPSLVGAKIVGRWPDGSPLALYPKSKPPNASNENAFGYADDRGGVKCPVGAHIRRANPRDGMGSSATFSDAETRRHRILRRGRNYQKNGDDAGIMFKCFNTSLSRQFEHVQQSWIGHQEFGPRGEIDPLIGSHSRKGTKTLVIDRCPAPVRIEGLTTFVDTIGGGYFFYPGIHALHAIVARGDG